MKRCRCGCDAYSHFFPSAHPPSLSLFNYLVDNTSCLVPLSHSHLESLLLSIITFTKLSFQTALSSLSHFYIVTFSSFPLPSSPLSFFSSSSLFLSSIVTQESGLEKVFLPKLALWYCADFGRDTKSRVAKLLLISQKGGRSSAVLTGLLGRYADKDKESADAGTYFLLSHSIQLRFILTFLIFRFCHPLLCLCLSKISCHYIHF